MRVCSRALRLARLSCEMQCGVLRPAGGGIYISGAAEMLKTSVSCFEDQHLRGGGWGGMEEEWKEKPKRGSDTSNGASAAEAISAK